MGREIQGALRGRDITEQRGWHGHVLVAMSFFNPDIPARRDEDVTMPP
jgi:hypothetical protein